MKIFIDKSEIRKLKRRLLRAYPKERLEFMWGKFRKPDQFHIHVFDHVPQTSTSRSVSYADEEPILSAIHAKTAGLILLGSIHSHPNCYDCAPSETDYDEGLKLGEMLSGIALINKNDNGRKSVKIRFWGPLQSVDPVYF